MKNRKEAGVTEARSGHYSKCEIAKGADVCWCEVRRYHLIFAIGILFCAIEVAGGLVSGSLALLSDAGHVAVDAAAALIASITVYFAKKYHRQEGKIRANGGYLNSILLVVIAGFVIWEAVLRILAPREILTGTMLFAAVLGAIGNYVQHKILEAVNPEERKVTHEALDFHILTDMWQSVAIIGVGIVVALTGKTIVDPIVSIVVAIAMIWWAIKLFKKSRMAEIGARHEH